MKIQHYAVEQLKQDVLAILGKHLDLTHYRVFFFGSRVSGRATERADIDIGVEGLEPVPTQAWLAIQEEIENLPTLYKVEMVDFTRVPPMFREVALQAVEPITHSR